MGMINDHMSGLSRGPTDTETLRHIRSLDPDGKTNRPSDRDRKKFQEHVVDNFGPNTWRAYTQTNWDW